MEALHRRDRPFQRLDDLEHRDLRRRPRQAVAAVGAAGRGDQAGLAQLRDQVLEVGERQALRLGDRAERDRLTSASSPARRPSSTIRRTPYSALVENSI